MNKYKEDFDMVTRLCSLDSRERTILNYGIEEGREKAIDEFAERIKSFVDCGHLCSPTEIRWSDLSIVEMIDRIAEQLKGGAV